MAKQGGYASVEDLSDGRCQRGIGSATGLYFLESLIVANIPAFLWLAGYGLRISQLAREA